MTQRRCRATVWPILGVAAIAACSGERGGVAGPRPADTAQFTLIVSNPLAAAGAASADREAVSAISLLEVVYVSIPPGAVPDGVEAVIRNRGTGFSVTRALLSGALDPTPIPAGVGDTIEVAVRTLGGQIVTAAAVVAARRPPIVVRTDPPPKKTDVPLNVTIIVVFSEPIDPATLDTTTIRLLRGGSAVAGTVGLQPGSIVAAEFVPAAPLELATPYVLVVTRGVRDLAGDSLEAAVTVDFTTAPLRSLEFAAVTTGEAHTCAMTVTGQAVCWGHGGRLGTGDTIGAVAPRRVSGAPLFVVVDAGAFHTCALAPVAYCWGPGEAQAVVGSPEFTILSSGGRDCAVSATSTVYCWGPFRVRGGSWIIQFRPLAIADTLSFASVSSGSNHDCGLTNEGKAYCWGAGHLGQLGSGGLTSTIGLVNDTLSIEVLPVSGGLLFDSVSAGESHTCGVERGGVAYCWGDNLWGQLGVEAVNWETCNSWPCSPIPLPVAGTRRFVSVSAGSRHTCAIDTIGSAYCWGDNSSGQLGDRTTTNRAAPVPVEGELTFAVLSAGGSHTCGITTGGIVYCWGDNGDGQLGDGTTQSRAAPTRVVGQR